MVDDDPVFLRLVTLALEGAGYQIETARTAEEGGRRARESRPDLMLVDVVLPGRSGVELCREVKGDPTTSGVFVLLISGYRTNSGRQVEGLEAGADGYLARPVADRELVARVDSLFRLRRAQAALQESRDELERRVADRTAELSRANERLRDEMAERQQLEARVRQTQRLEAVGQLAAGLAHDFNNLLTVITCNLALLANDQRMPGELRVHLDDMAEAAERGTELTRRMLLFTRQQVMQPRLLDLNQALERWSGTLRTIVGESVGVQLRLAEALPRISADPGMIEQAVVNLSLNARDAMPGGGTLTLATTSWVLDAAAAAKFPGAKPGRYVCLAVSDTGVGMDAATRERVFDAFFTTKVLGRGTGLGLAMVHGVVTQHRGWVDVESEAGRGATFRLYLPASDDGGRGPGPESGAARASAAEARTILVVEDEPSVCNLARAILQRRGYRVLTAPSGVAAWKVWQEHRDAISLVLSDVVMPEGMSGWDLAAKVAADRPRTPIILMSGYGTQSMGQDVVLPEGYRFLEKPFDPAKLAEIVREALQA